MSILYIAYRPALDCDASLRHLGVQGLLKPAPDQWCFPAQISPKELSERLARASRIVWVCPQLGTESLWDEATGPLFSKPVWSKTVVLGARVHDGWSPSEVAQARWKGAVVEGRVSVEGEEDRERLRRVSGTGVGSAGVVEVGPLSCWGNYPSLQKGNHPRDVFVPPPFPQSGTHPKEMALLTRWRQGRPTLFMAGDKGDFRWSPDVSAETFFSPRFPQHHGIALGSAHRVLSGRCDPVFAAIGQGVPAIRLQVAESPGYRGDSPVPELALYDQTQIASDEEILRSLFENYPWDAVRSWLKKHRTQCERFVKKHGLRAVMIKKPKDIAAVFCSVADIHYAPSVLGWVENVRAHHPRARFHLLALDDEARRLFRDQWDSGVQVHTLEDLWSAEEVRVIRERSRGYQAFSSKARLLLRALGEGLPTVYCDADIHLYSPIDDLDFSKGVAAYLFPHFNDDFDCARHDGLFNAGLVAVQPGAERFLHWWSAACLQACGDDRERGVVGDQGYLDFAPVLFPEVKVHRKGNHNVARWNQLTLGLRLPPAPEACPLVREEFGVGAYHAAFPDSARVSEGKTTWDQLTTFFMSTRDLAQSPPLWQTVVQGLENYWPQLGRAVRFRRILSSWLGGDPLVPAKLQRWVRGWRSRLLERLANSGSGSAAAASVPELSWWVRGQRAGWQEREKPASKKPSKKPIKKRRAA